MNTQSQPYDFPIKISDIKADDILIPRRYAVIRTDTNEPLGIISDKYQLVHHKTVIDSFRQALVQTNTDLEEDIALSLNGAYLNAKYTFSKYKDEILKGDYVSMQIYLENSYDTTTSIKFVLGALRLACTNGLIVTERVMSFSQRHTTQQFIVKDMADKIIELGSYFNKRVIPQMRKMSLTYLKPEKSSEGYNKYIKNKTFPLWLIDEAKYKYREEDNTVWEFYNSFTYAIRLASSRLGVKSQTQFLKKAWNEAARLL